MRLLPTSLTLVSFTIAAGLAGCGSDAPSNPGTAGGSNSAAGATTTVPGAGAAGKPNVATAGNGSGGAPVGSAGSGNPIAGANSVAGSSPTAGSGGSGNATSTGGSGGKATGSGGTTGSSGAGNTAGAANPNAPDAKGKTNAKGGDMTSANLDYLKLGEMRLINNNWGSVAWGCAGTKSKESVFVSADKSSFGWNFDRGDCDTGNTNGKPDYPEIEFGIHPFGLGSSEATSPDFSTTTLLPKQLKDITEASVEVKNLVITLDKPTSWNINFEFWLSKQNPATTQGNAGVYAELMTFWGWENNRWPLKDGGSPICDIGCTNGLSAGSKIYDLIVQKESWGSGWKYFQFRSTGMPQTSFNGTVDVKKLIDYMVQKAGATQDMWLTRMEIGSEIDDDTKGSVKMSSVTFSVNGEKRSPVFGQ